MLFGTVLSVQFIPSGLVIYLSLVVPIATNSVFSGLHTISVRPLFAGKFLAVQLIPSGDVLTLPLSATATAKDPDHTSARHVSDWIALDVHVIPSGDVDALFDPSNATAINKKQRHCLV